MQAKPMAKNEQNEHKDEMRRWEGSSVCAQVSTRLASIMQGVDHPSDQTDSESAGDMVRPTNLLSQLSKA